MVRRRLRDIPVGTRAAYWHQAVLHLYRYLALVHI